VGECVCWKCHVMWASVVLDMVCHFCECVCWVCRVVCGYVVF
jgi:hypothetical protein